MNFKQNNIKIGIMQGLLLPFLGYWLWKGIFGLLTLVQVMDPTGFSESWRERTFALLAICMNIIPFQYHQKNRNDDTMRGLVFPTVMFVVIWVVVFREDIFGQF